MEADFIKDLMRGDHIAIKVFTNQIFPHSIDGLVHNIKDTLFFEWKDKGFHEKVLKHIQTKAFEKKIIEGIAQEIIRRSVDKLSVVVDQTHE